MHTPDEGDSPLTSEYQGELVVEEAEAQVPQESPPPGNDEEYDLAPDFLPQGNEADHDRGILAQLRENLHEPYGPPSGSKPAATVLQECYFKARMKIEHNQTNQALELELNRNSRAVGEPNHYPRSLYLMEKCLGIEHPDMYERHVCVNDHHLFPHARPWQYDAAEVCTFPGCGELRYKNVGTVKDPKLKARKAFWYFGLDKILQQFFNDKVWCKLRRAGIADSVHDLRGFRQSREFRRLKSKIQGASDIDNPDNSVYDIGFDFGQLFTWKTHSAGILGIR